ncbi:MFS transporter [Nocardioides sp. BP30]|uniref:MFS transporter n=1 Tax=Nocardioides sp. BP30 TaxID=3036374 RepID=UPI002468347F|nr:MFS transporter [Nocardioides sp. BP30]WGL51237.1 MFS transporter [Nocardioides sp. BP30]
MAGVPPSRNGLVALSVTPSPLRSRNAVVAAFALNGFLFASLVSRLPDVRSALELSNAQLGLLLLSASVGSLVMLPFSGRLIERFGAATVVRVAAVGVAAGVVVAALGATVVGWVPLAALGMLSEGMGLSAWDVAMNVEGAEVERRLGRTIMPRFHAAWSMGSIAGSGIGIPMAALGVPAVVHLLVVGVPAYGGVLAACGAFLPVQTHAPDPTVPGERRASAWREPRTLLVGVMVLAFAAVEGSANDWLSLGLIDGYDVPHWVGVAGFSLFVVAMTTGRFVGPVALDRFGRAPVLWACTVAGLVGVLLTVYGAHLAVAAVGIVIWGLGASLGFPVGMSAAADDPRRAAARVSVVSTIGYGAFLIGPPFLGAIGDRIGTLQALLVVAALMVPAAFSVLAARPQRGPVDAADLTG